MDADNSAVSESQMINKAGIASCAKSNFICSDLLVWVGVGVCMSNQLLDNGILNDPPMSRLSEVGNKLDKMDLF